MTQPPTGGGGPAGSNVPPGTQGPLGVGTGSDVPGPLQLEKAWHNLMWTMGVTQAKRSATLNSAARNIRRTMVAR